jgi:hypothetical protein
MSSGVIASPHCKVTGTTRFLPDFQQLFFLQDIRIYAHNAPFLTESGHRARILSGYIHNHDIYYGIYRLQCKQLDSKNLHRSENGTFLRRRGSIRVPRSA